MNERLLRTLRVRDIKSEWGRMSVEIPLHDRFSTVDRKALIRFAKCLAWTPALYQAAIGLSSITGLPWGESRIYSVMAQLAIAVALLEAGYAHYNNLSSNARPPGLPTPTDETV